MTSFSLFIVEKFISMITKALIAFSQHLLELELMLNPSLSIPDHLPLGMLVPKPKMITTLIALVFVPKLLELSLLSKLFLFPVLNKPYRKLSEQETP